MREIPNKLKCAYCIRNRLHGGECGTQSLSDEKGCLAFSPNPKGCIRTRDFKLPFKLYAHPPMLDEWSDNWQINGVDTEIRITKIYGFGWDMKKGNLIVHCRCDYYVNEYSEDYKSVKEKPKLTIIK